MLTIFFNVLYLLRKELIISILLVVGSAGSFGLGQGPPDVLYTCGCRRLVQATYLCKRLML